MARVADRAGVSVASVSRVLNGLPASAATAAKVQAAAAELDYRPHAMARSLKVRRTEQLALAVADVGNPVYVDMMRAIEEVARDAGYRLVLSSTGSDPEAMLDILRRLDHGFADGLVLSPLRVTAEIVAQLRAVRVPTVVIGTLPPEVPVDNVRADSPAGVRLALRHLYDGGHRRVAFVNGPADTVPGSARARGFERTAARFALDPVLRINASDFTYSAGRTAAAELLDRATPEAVLAVNDLLAIGVVKELTERGLRVPEDVAVVGMDDTELAALATPALTSVGLGSAERGRLAARLLLDRITDPDRAAHGSRSLPGSRCGHSRRHGSACCDDDRRPHRRADARAGAELRSHDLRAGLVVALARVGQGRRFAASALSQRRRNRPSPRSPGSVEDLRTQEELLSLLMGLDER